MRGKKRIIWERPLGTDIGLAPESDIEVERDTDEQTVLQAATKLTIAISVPPEKKAPTSRQLCNSEWQN